MAQLSANHETYAFVVKDFDRQAESITDPANSKYIKEGEVVVSGLDNKLVTTTSSTYAGVQKVKISQLTDQGLISSPPLDFDSLNFYKVTKY